MRLNRLPRPASSTSLPHVFPHSPHTHRSNCHRQTHTCTALYLSLALIVSCHHVGLSHPVFPLQYLILGSTSCVLLARRALASSTTQLLRNLRYCAFMCVCAFWEEGEVRRKKTSLITLLFLSMLSQTVVLKRVEMENVLHILHKHTNHELH